jgi:hypothetical protein
MQNVDWGSVPDWLAGVGAVIALIFAGLAARAAMRANAQQNVQILAIESQQREREGEKRRWQASRVSIWLHPHRDRLPTIEFHNGSGLPIYNATAVATCGNLSTARRYAVRTPSEQPAPLVRLTESFHTLLESQEVAEENPNDPGDRERWYRLIATNSVSVRLSFQDSSGNWWTRMAEGALIEHESQDAAEAAIANLNPSDP